MSGRCGLQRRGDGEGGESAAQGRRFEHRSSRSIEWVRCPEEWQARCQELQLAKSLQSLTRRSTPSTTRKVSFAVDTRPGPRSWTVPQAAHSAYGVVRRSASGWARNQDIISRISSIASGGSGRPAGPAAAASSATTARNASCSIGVVG